MRVITGSLNPPKCQSVERAFNTMFPGEEIEFITIKTRSSVSDNPVAGDETLRGAINRAMDAKRQQSDGDYFVGIEDGLLAIQQHTWKLGMVAILRADGQIHTGISCGIEMSGRILQSVQQGTELSRVLADNFGVEEIGKERGFYGLATDDRVTRTSAYIEAVILAISPFLNPQYFVDEGDES